MSHKLNHGLGCCFPKEGEAAVGLGVKDLVDRGIDAVPAVYIQPQEYRPIISSSVNDVQIPVIDISALSVGDSDSRSAVLRRIADACSEWGFFQVVGHGVNTDIIDNLRVTCASFFQLPAEERNKFRDHRFNVPVKYVTSSNPSFDTVLDWKDSLFVKDSPGFIRDGFLIAPTVCREAMQDYKREMKKIGNVLYQAIFESLGLSHEYIKECVPEIDRVTVTVNYYPKCPDPSLTIGLSGHTDPNSFTLLLQDEVPGLQVKHNDQWIPVPPLTNAFVVNIANQLEILTNGKYKSVEHRVVTNSNQDRMSIAFFFGPLESTKIGPLSELVSENEQSKYQEIVFGDYMKHFSSQSLVANKGSLSFAKGSTTLKP